MKVLVITSRRFNGHELWTALGVLHKEGVEFEVVATHPTIADEVDQGVYTISRVLDDLSPEDVLEFDGLMVVSGNPRDTEVLWTHQRAQKAVRTAFEADLPLGAICAAVPSIRLAAKGKRVTYYPLMKARDLLRRAGAEFVNTAVHVDGKLVTAEHQMATSLWAECFVKVLRDEDADPGLLDPSEIFKPGRWKGKFPVEVEFMRKKFKQAKGGEA